MPTGTIYSVTQLSEIIKGALEIDPRLKSLWLKGEITNYKHHSSGHLYFSIKDNDSAIKAIMFKGYASKLTFEPKTGMNCIFRGYVSSYTKENTVQFYCEYIEQDGVGAQALALEELKKKLAAKGYFNPARKKEIPFLPKAIGVISSPTGAVLQDIRNVTWRRYPGMPIYLYPAAVQGAEAVNTLIEGIKAMEYAPVDVVIIGRGGGSAEDLSAFNDEKVADALFNLSKPVIAAIGHETDYSIADMVADKRAATPSQAAEFAVPEKITLLSNVYDHLDRLTQAVNKICDHSQEKLRLIKDSQVYINPERIFNTKQENLLRLSDNLDKNLNLKLEYSRNILTKEIARLDAMSPLKVLARGYSMVQDTNNHVITDSSQVKIDDEIKVSLSKGTIDCKVLGRSV